MDELVKALKRHIQWQEVTEVDGVIHVQFSQNERMHLKNIKTSGKYSTNPSISMDGSAPSKTFYIARPGIEPAVYEELMRTPIVFNVNGIMDKGIKAEYNHWTLNGYLHRDGAPAYQAWYYDHNRHKDVTEMYFHHGLLHRMGGPAITIYKNVIEEKDKRNAGGIIRQFDYLIMECRHYDGVEERCVSWPYVQRMTLWYGRQLFIDQVLQQTAAKKASAKWLLTRGLEPGIYPVTMDMKGFHEWWKGPVIDTRVVNEISSKWIKINSNDKRPITWTDMRMNAIESFAFDADFKPMVPRVGFVEKPFYDDPEVEFAVLTDLSNRIEEREIDNG